MIDLGNDRTERCDAHDEPPCVATVLEAIDHLLDAMEGLEAPITRELLGTAMMALVHECGLGRPVVN
jgi:hypothetical protein